MQLSRPQFVWTPQAYVPPNGLQWVESVPGNRSTEIANLETAIKRLRSGKPPQNAQSATEAKPQPVPNEVTTTTDAKPIRPAAPVEASPLQANQWVLANKQDVPATWDEWYQRVAKMMYYRWQQNYTGAGTATLAVTVYASRDVDGKIIDFKAASDVAHDQSMDDRFKSTALKCVDSLSRDAGWQFPTSAGRTKKVTFDIELKHAVGQDVGCRVVHTHNESGASD
jgi:hypothetical protein